jgi:hypothetical protein
MHSYAQNNEQVFTFLSLPVSSRAAALGGENITLVEDDPSMIQHNPALLSCVADQSINFNYLSYIKGTGMASATFAKFINDRSGWALSARYIDYGKIRETDVDDHNLGEFSAKDIAIGATYCYDLSDYWSGGITSNFILGKYHTYSSFAIGVDLGLNYYNSDTDFSASIVLKNLGGQIKSFDQVKEKLPVNLAVGISKRLAHAPFRFSFTFQGLNDWSSAYTNDGKKEKSLEKIVNHCIFGIDFVPSDNFYLALGYNCRRSDELSIEGGSKWTGMSLGAGINIKRIKIGMSYAKYHTSGSSFQLSLSTSL